METEGWSRRLNLEGGSQPPLKGLWPAKNRWGHWKSITTHHSACNSFLWWDPAQWPSRRTFRPHSYDPWKTEKMDDSAADHDELFFFFFTSGHKRNTLKSTDKQCWGKALISSNWGWPRSMCWEERLISGSWEAARREDQKWCGVHPCDQRGGWGAERDFISVIERKRAKWVIETPLPF